MPVVGETSRDRQRAMLTAPADENRQGRLRRRRLAEGILHRVVDAAIGGRRASSQRSDDRARLLETVQPLAHVRKRNAVGAVLVRLPSGTDAESQSTGAELVHRGGHIRNDSRVTIGAAE